MPYLSSNTVYSNLVMGMVVIVVYTGGIDGNMHQTTLFTVIWFWASSTVYSNPVLGSNTVYSNLVLGTGYNSGLQEGLMETCLYQAVLFTVICFWTSNTVYSNLAWYLALGIVLFNM